MPTLSYLPPATDEYTPDERPGSAGEHALQAQYRTEQRAHAFYDRQLLDHLNDAMCAFLTRQEMAFIATADAAGNCDCSFRAGPPDFLQALAPRTLIYPEYRSNGVMASLGNISENAHIGLLVIDFLADTIGLHINGRAAIVETAALLAHDDLPTSMPESLTGGHGTRPERWVLVTVEEAYMHCSKHIPRLMKADKALHWCTDDPANKGGDYFRAKHSPRSWTSRENAAQEVVPACGLPLALTMSTAITRQTDTGELDDVARDECAAVDAGDQESADHREEAVGIVPTQRDQPAPQESRAALPQCADNQHTEVESGATHPSESGVRGWFARLLTRV
jgi:predicted pyridoxine 5'-phosphate oxidase superfamily flavin-nucleotide-binding protein